MNRKYQQQLDLISLCLWCENPDRSLPGWMWRDRYRSLRLLAQRLGVSLNA